MNNARDNLIACHECDLLQQAIELTDKGVVRCGRCNAELYRYHPASLDHSLAFTLGALVLFVISNLFDMVGLSAQGNVVETTLYGTVQALHRNQMNSIAVLVFLTTILMPAAQILAMGYLMLPLRLGVSPRYFAPVMRVLQTVRPWGMVEVFMLGVLVALTKLAHIASVIPGVALWAFVGLILMLTAASAAFDGRTLWRLKEAYDAPTPA